MRNASYFPSYKWPYYVFFPQIRKLDQGSHTISNRKFKDLYGLSKTGDLVCAKTLKKETLNKESTRRIWTCAVPLSLNEHVPLKQQL